MSRQRAERVRVAIREEISDILQNELKDPRVGFASIVDVEVSPDLRHARVYVSVLGDERSGAQTLEGLESARGYIRTEVGRRLRLRHAPELEFKLDRSIERGSRISQIIRRIQAGEME